MNRFALALIISIGIMGSSISAMAVTADKNSCPGLLRPFKVYSYSERLEFLWGSVPVYSPAVSFSWPEFNQLVDLEFYSMVHRKKGARAGFEPRNLEEMLASIEATCRFSWASPHSLEGDIRSQNAKAIKAWLDILLSGGKNYRKGLNAVQIENVLSGLYMRAQGNPGSPWDISNFTSLDPLFGAISRRLAEQFAVEGIMKTSTHLGLAKSPEVLEEIEHLVETEDVTLSLLSLIETAVYISHVDTRSEDIGAQFGVPKPEFRWIKIDKKTLQRALLYGADDVKGDLMKALKKANLPPYRYEQIRLIVASASAAILAYCAAENVNALLGNRSLTPAQKLNLEFGSDSLGQAMKNYAQTHLRAEGQKGNTAVNSAKMNQALFDAWTVSYKEDHGKEPATTSTEYLQIYGNFIGKK